MTNNSEYTYADFIAQILKIDAAMAGREQEEEVLTKYNELVNRCVSTGNASDITLNPVK